MVSIPPLQWPTILFRIKGTKDCSMMIITYRPCVVAVMGSRAHQKIWVGGTRRKDYDDSLTPPVVFEIGWLRFESRLYPTSCFGEMILELQLSFIPHLSF